MKSNWAQILKMFPEIFIKSPLARLIQNDFTGEAKAGEARKTGFSRLLVHFSPGLQNGFMLQCLDLRKIGKAEADISRAKEALNVLIHILIIQVGFKLFWDGRIPMISSLDLGPD